MLKLREQRRFLRESTPRLVAQAQIFVEHFDRDRLTVPKISGEPNERGPTLPELAHQAEAPVDQDARRSAFGRPHRAKRATLCALIAIAAGAACRDKALTLDAPVTISRVATIELEGGAVVATTPLAKLGEGDAFWIEASARETLVVGYEDAQLVDPQTGELPESIDTDLLARGDPCGPLLPQPAWVARLDAREAAPIDPALAPALSAPWLTTRCAPPAAIDLDVRCDEPRCISETRRSSACTLEVTSAGCALERITLRYRGSELACLETQGSTWQCVQESSADGRDVFQCGEDLACIVEVHPRDRDEAPPHDVVRLQFGEGGPLIPNTNGQVTMTLPRRLYDYGYGFEVLPLDGRVVITSSPIGGSPAPCPDGQERRLVFVDPDAMIVTGTATAPTCLERLERESGTTFLGGFRENGQPMIGRFDRDGNLLRAISLADGARTAITHVLKIKKSSTGFVVLLSNLMGAGVDGASDLVFLNTDLSIRSRHISAELLYALTIVGPTRAAVWTLGGPGTNNMLIVSGDGDPVVSSSAS
jgi:hypothetical protein